MPAGPPAVPDDEGRRGLSQGTRQGLLGSGLLLVALLVLPRPGSATSGTWPRGVAGTEAMVVGFVVGPALAGLGCLLVGIAIVRVHVSMGRIGEGWTAAWLRSVGRPGLIPSLLLAMSAVAPEPLLDRAAASVESLGQTQPLWSGITGFGLSTAMLGGWAAMTAVLVDSDRWPTWNALAFGASGLLAAATTLPLLVALGAFVLGAGWLLRAHPDAARQPYRTHKPGLQRPGRFGTPLP